jgi:phosphoglucomutase
MRIKDVSLGYDSITGRTVEDKLVGPSAEMITFELEKGIVMTLRGSGTEPKLKYYIEAKGSSMEEAEGKAGEVEKALTLVLKELAS